MSPEFVSIVVLWYKTACESSTGGAPQLWKQVMETGVAAGMAKEAIKPAATAIIIRISAGISAEALIASMATNFGRIVSAESLASTARVTAARAAGVTCAIVAIALTCGATSQDVKEQEKNRADAADNYPGYLQRYVIFAMRRFAKTGNIPPQPFTFEEFVANTEAANFYLQHMRKAR